MTEFKGAKNNNFCMLFIQIIKSIFQCIAKHSTNKFLAPDLSFICFREYCFHKQKGWVIMTKIITSKTRGKNIRNVMKICYIN